MTKCSIFLKSIWKERYLLPFFFCLLFVFAGCKSKTATTTETAQYQALRLQRYSDSIYPMLSSQVRSGDLVTRLGSDMTSEMLRQMNQSDKSFSHCGIASIEHDTIFVYHAIGGEFNPDQVIKREPLYSFGHSEDNKAIGLYRMDAPQIKTAAIATIARKFYLKKIPFDMAFNYESEDRFYCAEYVAKCIGRAIGDSSWLRFCHSGKLRYVAVDNLFQNSIARLIHKKMY